MYKAYLYKPDFNISNKSFLITKYYNPVYYLYLCIVHFPFISFKYKNSYLQLQNIDLASSTSAEVK